MMTSSLHLSGLCRVRVDREALRHNVRVFRRLCPESRFCAVVKSNAYGHGLRECVEALRGQVDWFGVNTPEEAAFLRSLDLETPVLILGLGGLGLGGFQGGDKTKAAFSCVPSSVVVIPDRGHLAWVRKHLPNQKFHLKIDTGLSRLGMSLDEFRDCLDFLSNEGGISLWTGLMTHFANVEDVTDQSYAKEQLRRFEEARQLALSFKKDLMFHTAASAAAMILPESRMDLVRVGISLYGLWPSTETRLSLLSQLGEIPELRPALSWQARIVQTHAVRAGDSLGYGCTHRMERDGHVAVLPVGYYEGYDRSLSNQSYVLLHGRRAPVLGRVSMNMIIVDISWVPEARVGDWATLIGTAEAAPLDRSTSEERSVSKKGLARDSITAEQLAEWSGSISYEVVTRILPGIPRELV